MVPGLKTHCEQVLGVPGHTTHLRISNARAGKERELLDDAVKDVSQRQVRERAVLVRDLDPDVLRVLHQRCDARHDVAVRDLHALGVPCRAAAPSTWHRVSPSRRHEWIMRQTPRGMAHILTKHVGQLLASYCVSNTLQLILVELCIAQLYHTASE